MKQSVGDWTIAISLLNRSSRNKIKNRIKETIKKHRERHDVKMNDRTYRRNIYCVHIINWKSIFNEIICSLVSRGDRIWFRASEKNNEEEKNEEKNEC